MGTNKRLVLHFTYWNTPFATNAMKESLVFNSCDFSNSAKEDTFASIRVSNVEVVSIDPSGQHLQLVWTARCRFLRGNIWSIYMG